MYGYQSVFSREAESIGERLGREEEGWRGRGKGREGERERESYSKEIVSHDCRS